MLRSLSQKCSEAADARPHRCPWTHIARKQVLARESNRAFFLPRQLFPRESERSSASLESDRRMTSTRARDHAQKKKQGADGMELRIEGLLASAPIAVPPPYPPFPDQSLTSAGGPKRAPLRLDRVTIRVGEGRICPEAQQHGHGLDRTAVRLPVDNNQTRRRKRRRGG